MSTETARRGKRPRPRPLSVHDPSTIVRCDGDYWFFATGVGVVSRRSRDLTKWEIGPSVFPEDALPEWRKRIKHDHKGHFWAPDLLRVNGRWLLYYSVSSWGVNASAIGLATTPTLNPDDPAYGWKDDGIVLRTTTDCDFNAIDPCLTLTPDGDLWMSLGSFWTGIKLIRLDPATGKRIAPDSPIHALACHRSIEAPCIYFRDGYYYLFVNWGLCCKGVDSTYNIRVGRCREITGPYLDREGVDLMNGGGTLLLETEGRQIGPGHAGILEEDGRYRFSYHYYDGERNGIPMLGIRDLYWEDGWMGLGAPMTLENVV